MYTVPVINNSRKINKDVSPQNYILTFVYEDTHANIKIHDEAVRLVEHMTIIDESRKLIKKGKTVTWDEFVSNETK